MTHDRDAARTAIQDGSTSLGIELGSTRIKAVLVDAEGAILATGAHGWSDRLEDGHWTYALDDVATGLAAAYAALVLDSTRAWGVAPTSIGAVGVSAMMHGYLAFDAEDALLVPFRTWRNSTTGAAATLLGTTLGRSMPLRWSASHLLQVVLDREEHLARLARVTTLAGHVHVLLGGHPVLGADDASGMFPLLADGSDYDGAVLDAFDRLAAEHGATDLRVRDLLPTIRPVGEDAGTLSDAGAALLDPTGRLLPGAALCPPEGDAGTGMVATRALAPGTGNVSVGTSIFAMVVVDGEAPNLPDVDVVATPEGAPVAMVHCNNGVSELGAWATLLGELSEASGHRIEPDETFAAMLSAANDATSEGIVAYNFVAGEHALGLQDGRPIVVRAAGTTLTLGGFVRAQLLSAFATLQQGMQVLREHGVRVDELVAHGGLFRSTGIAQRILAASLEAPVRVSASAGEGGAWGMALLAAYRLARVEGEERPLRIWLLERSGIDAGTVVAADAALVAESRGYAERWRAGLPLARLAPEVVA
ncbi:FGGY-family carbohydrate kinase [Agrococcus versicolor]|uniref:FGGY-family carbohydrate kinase n=1 Tax=Agrococcus versicolor TaxID=501482 RepID=A0ABP5M898_9MICO